MGARLPMFDVLKDGQQKIQELHEEQMEIQRKTEYGNEYKESVEDPLALEIKKEMISDDLTNVENNEMAPQVECLQPLKRKPGRPPKPKVNVDSSIIPKRKPGRPPKLKADGSVLVDRSIIPKRKPGRPFKINSNSSVAVDGSMKPKRKRGRPFKIKPSSPVVVDSSIKPKRKRGRPRKQTTEVEVQEVEDTSADFRNQKEIKEEEISENGRRWRRRKLPQRFIGVFSSKELDWIRRGSEMRSSRLSLNSDITSTNSDITETSEENMKLHHQRAEQGDQGIMKEKPEDISTANTENETSDESHSARKPADDCSSLTQNSTGASKSPIFRCTRCSLKFKTKESCEEHMKSHFPKKHFACKPFSCNDCGKKFTHKFHLQRHQLSHSDYRPYSCKFCGARFKMKTRFLNHCAKHVEEIEAQGIKEETSEIESSVNGSVTEIAENDPQKMMQKVSPHRTWVINSKELEKILKEERITVNKEPNCPKQKEDDKETNQVIDESTRTDKAYLCDVCGKVMKKFSALINHKRLVHRGIRRKRHLTCKKCGKKFKMKTNFQQHQLTHCRNEQMNALDKSFSPQESSGGDSSSLITNSTVEIKRELIEEAEMNETTKIAQKVSQVVLEVLSDKELEQMSRNGEASEDKEPNHHELQNKSDEHGNQSTAGYQEERIQHVASKETIGQAKITGILYIPRYVLHEVSYKEMNHECAECWKQLRSENNTIIQQEKTAHVDQWNLKQEPEVLITMDEVRIEDEMPVEIAKTESFSPQGSPSKQCRVGDKEINHERNEHRDQLRSEDSIELHQENPVHGVKKTMKKEPEEVIMEDEITIQMEKIEPLNESFSSQEPMSDSLPATESSTETSEPPIFRCDKCSQEFETEEACAEHIKSHSSKKRFACPVCDKTFPYKSNVKYHKARHHAYMRPGKAFPCDICGVVKHLYRALLGHKKLVHGVYKPFRCSQCGKKFKDRHNFEEHQSTHTDVWSFSCKICNMTFKKKWCFDKHVFDKLCSGKGLNISSALQSDQLKEIEDNGNKRFICDKCGRSYKDKAYFLRHQKEHFERQTLPCEFCDASFKSRRELMRHTLQHTGLSHHLPEEDKPYTCPLCQKSFFKNGILRNHMARHAGEDRYTCDKCPSKFISLGQLKKHRFSYHGQKNSGSGHNPKSL